MDKMAQALNAKVITPIYPKVPHFNYQDTYPKMLSFYKEILASIESSNQLTIIGDSAGGNIALGLIQQLKRDNLPQPQDIILLSACVDMSLENPLIQEYEENDPMLASEGMEVLRLTINFSIHVVNGLSTTGRYQGISGQFKRFF